MDSAQLHDDVGECFSETNPSTCPDFNDLLSKYVYVKEIFDTFPLFNLTW